ncbi:MAG: ATP-binding cassette domain-containing protein [Rhodospirillales bacterium]
MLDRVMQISVLGIGAHAVFAGSMSIGALVAFTMLAARVSGPLLQVVGLINEYQETALSVQMLGSVMDQPPERAAAANATRPAMTGAVSFDQVSFRYPGAVTPALDRVSFSAAQGQVIGVVGRSGSGQDQPDPTDPGHRNAAIRADPVRWHRHTPHRSRASAAQRRRRAAGQFPVRGTIHENIAAGRPNAPLGEIVQAAHLAGADEFIDRLPLGYETPVEEEAANFSGGQRQRISIARALLTKPRLLIFDEATSALDPESEAILQENLKSIAAGRTMIVVSHRLASLVQADAILVLDHGAAVDCAPHATLLQRCPLYRGLWQQQTRHMGVV